MAERIFIFPNANILIFLTYLSRDPLIISSLLKTAQGIFPTDSPATLDLDVWSLNKLLDEVPKLVIEQLDVDEARDKSLIEKDEIEKDIEEDEFTVDAGGLDELGLIDRVTVAFKVAEILGQIAKNYYGSLDAEPKIELVKTTFDLVLRPLGKLLKDISDNRESVATEIVKIIQKHALSTIEDREQIMSFASKFVFGLCSLMSFGFIERISVFVGTEDLSQTFHRLVSQNATNAYRLIDAAIHLDHFADLPIEELRRLNSDISHNPLAQTVLARLVRNYLYMFEVDYVRRQQICEEFKIEMAETRKISMVSRDRKGER